MSAQNLINNYSLLKNSYIKASKSEKELIKAKFVSIFDSAKHIEIKNLQTSARGYYYLFLGLENDCLQAILVHNSTLPDIKKIDQYSPIVLEFKSNSFTPQQNLNTKLTAENTEITIDEYNKRTKRWAKDKNIWIENALNSNLMVDYFIMNQENLKNNMSNFCVLSLIENSTSGKGQSLVIDFLSVNDAYMDRVRPVPPFKP